MRKKVQVALVEGASDRVRATICRMMRAWECSRELIHESHRLRRVSHELRANIPVTTLANSLTPSAATLPASDLIVWTTDDGLISCYVVPHAPDEHEVVVINRGSVVWSRTFADPVEATDESWRARRWFIG